MTIIVTALLVFFMGLDVKRSLLMNTLLTLTVLSLCFFIALSIALYTGIKMKETVGKFFYSMRFSGGGNIGSLPFEIDFPDTGEGIEGFLLSLFLWIVMTFALILFLVFFEAIVWAFFLIVTGALYWIFFRATRLALKKAPVCRGNLPASFLTAALYTILYSGWLYGMVAAALYLKNR